MTFCLDNLDDVRELTLNNIRDTEIRTSDIHGFGLFTTKPISKGAILCNLNGQVISKYNYEKITQKLTPLVSSAEKYLFMECNYISETEVLARAFRTKYSYINHSFQPNVEIKYFPIRIESLIDLDTGDELTLDYRREPLTKEYLSSPEKKFLQESLND